MWKIRFFRVISLIFCVKRLASLYVLRQSKKWGGGGGASGMSVSVNNKGLWNSGTGFV